MLGASELSALNRMYEAGAAGAVADVRQVYGLITTLLEQPVEPIEPEQSCKNEPMLRQFVQIAHDEVKQTRCRWPRSVRCCTSARAPWPLLARTRME